MVNATTTEFSKFPLDTSLTAVFPQNTSILCDAKCGVSVSRNFDRLSSSPGIRSCPQ